MPNFVVKSDMLDQKSIAPSKYEYFGTTQREDGSPDRYFLTC